MSAPFVPRAEPPDLTPFLPAAALLATTYADGRTDAAYCPYLYAEGDRRLSADGDTLFIGSAGVDGVEFGLKRGKAGVWVHAAYSDRWRVVAEDVESFERLWLAAKIDV